MKTVRNLKCRFLTGLCHWLYFVFGILFCTVFLCEAKESSSAKQSGMVYELLQKVEQLTSDVNRLRGEVEELSLQLKKQKNESKMRFLMLDDGITRLTRKVQGVNQVKNKSSDNAKTDIEKESRHFKRAFEKVEQKKFNEAREAFKKQVSDFPNGQLIANAWYWLGEVHMSLGEIKQAIDSFLKVLELHHSDGGKEAEAAYKLGKLYDTRGSTKKARYYLNFVIKNYGKSTAARLARTYLESMK